MADASWAPGDYNERDPYGRGSTVIAGDNIEFSKVRRAAIQAVLEHRATPEQRELVEETDRVITEAMENI